MLTAYSTEYNRTSGFSIFHALEFGTPIKHKGTAIMTQDRLKKKTTTSSAGYSTTALACKVNVD